MCHGNKNICGMGIQNGNITHVNSCILMFNHYLNAYQIAYQIIDFPIPKTIGSFYSLPSGNLTQLLKMTIEIVDFPIKDGYFPQLFVCLPEANPSFGAIFGWILWRSNWVCSQQIQYDDSRTVVTQLMVTNIHGYAVVFFCISKTKTAFCFAWVGQ